MLQSIEFKNKIVLVLNLHFFNTKNLNPLSWWVIQEMVITLELYVLLEYRENSDFTMIIFMNDKYL